jgi:hypothetical protein
LTGQSSGDKRLVRARQRVEAQWCELRASGLPLDQQEKICSLVEQLYSLKPRARWMAHKFIWENLMADIRAFVTPEEFIACCLAGARRKKRELEKRSGNGGRLDR